MKAKFVHENSIGDTKKQLLSGNNYTVTGINNISGGGNLFIKNQDTSQIQKCYSNDWNDIRKYSNVIIENIAFKRGEDPYNKLGIGPYKTPKINDAIRVNRNIYREWPGSPWSFNKRDWTPDTGGPLFEQNYFPVNTILYYHKVHTDWQKKDYIDLDVHHPIYQDSPYFGMDKVFFEKGIENGDFTFLPDYWNNKTNESLSFKRGGDPYNKLGIGPNNFIGNMLDEFEKDKANNYLKDEYINYFDSNDSTKYIGFDLRKPNISGITRISQYTNQKFINGIPYNWNNKVTIGFFASDNYDEHEGIYEYLEDDLILNINNISEYIRCGVVKYRDKIIELTGSDKFR